MQTQISLPDQLFQDLSQLAADRQETFDEVVRKASELYLARSLGRQADGTGKFPDPLDLGGDFLVDDFSQANVIGERLAAQNDLS